MQFDRKNEDTLENIDTIVKNNSHRQDALTKETKDELDRYRREIKQFKKEFSEKATKKEFTKTNEIMQENRTQFDTQFDLVKSELKTALGRIEKFTKLVTVLQGEMKLRDEALKRVPSNTHQILKDLNSKMDKTMKHVDTVDSKFVSKIDITEVEKLMGTKLDNETFAKIFPANKQPQEHLKNLIRGETESFNERVLNMIKLWDQKISNLRSELNIQSIYRKLGTFPRKEEVDEKI